MKPRSPEPNRLQVASWAARKVIYTPATWFGLAAGGAAGATMTEVANMGAGVGFGAMVGLVTAAVSHVIFTVARKAYGDRSRQQSQDTESKQREQEQTMLDKLKAIGLPDDSAVLSKLFEARNAVVDHSRGENAVAEQNRTTLELVTSLTNSALQRAAELVDLKQRLDDPILDKPPDAALRMAACQSDLATAYRAVADSRTQLLLHKEISAEEYLAESRPATTGGLGHLAKQLEEETALRRRVQARLHGHSQATGNQARSLGNTDAEFPREQE